MSVAFLFDNDGVLIDSSALHWRSWELFMKEEPTFSMSHEEFISGFGKRNDLLLKEILPHSSIAERKVWAERKEELFRQIARGHVALLPGMEPFLQTLKAKQIPRIIASSTPVANLEMYLNSTVLGTYFDGYLSAEEVAHGKPAPDIFIAAAERLGYTPRECIVLEDAPAGIAAGKAAGCFVVALATTHAKEALSDYDLLVASPDELDLEKILNAYREWK